MKPGVSNGTTEGWVANPDGRGTLDIVWSCVFTIFLCCWTSVCVNVPALSDSWLDQFRDKLSLALMGILGPDFLFTLALGQRDQAWKSVVRFREAGYADWTLVHAFFANMGGYLLDAPGCDVFPINSDELLYLVSKGYLEYPKTDMADIKDKSKSDGLARAITIVEVIWFTVNSITRVAQGQHLTTMELTTLGFIFVMLGTSFCWYHKPMDPGRPLILKTSTPIDTILDKAGSATANQWRHTPLDFIGRKECFMSLFWANYMTILRRLGFGFLAPRTMQSKPYNRIPSDYFPPIVRISTEFWGGVLVIIPYNAIFMCAWGSAFPSETERIMWRAASIATLLYGVVGGVLEWYSDHVVLPSQAPMPIRQVRSRTIPLTPLHEENWFKRLLQRMEARLKATSSSSHKRGRTTTVELGEHYRGGERQTSAQGTVQPPSRRKGWLAKRFASLAAMIRNNSPDQDPALEIPLRVWFPVTMLCAVYSVSRLYILTEDAIGLRKLPTSAFETVDWGRYLPHI